MTRTRLGVILLSLVAVLASAILFACSQTPTSVPVRTFERAARMDVACMQLYEQDPNGFHTREPLGRTQNECAPVPSTLDGNSFGKQLYAFVTQTSRGELAVVNLSAGSLIDQSRATPGINFLPVGALPMDVATTPDGKMAFVASAEPNKAAIYGIPTRRLLGDTDDRFPHDPDGNTLGSWPVCALPQNPGALVVVPRRTAAAAGGDAGTDAGAPASAELPEEYDLVVVLPGNRTTSAKIVTIDPRPFRRGGLKKGADGKPDYASDHLANEPATLNEGPVLEPGSLAACPILAATELIGDTALPKTFAPGPAWEDGVKYRDGGTDLTCLRPTQDPRCGARPCCPDAPVPALAPDAGLDAAAADAGPFLTVDAGACENVKPQDAGASPLDLGPLDPPQPTSVTRDDTTLYIADLALPLIHVIDMANPSQPRELPPLVVTSLTNPSVASKITEVAVSPPTRDYKRFLYAVEQIAGSTAGSIVVFDVTDPATMQRTPLTRPHPELDPFQPADRITFSSPVVTVQFARHDLPLAQMNGARTPSSASGLLCNPNKNLDANPLADLGFYYRANSSDPGQDIGGRRLRGIFAFATLSNGQVLTIDVDDWDSPCRRPRDMSVALSDITPAEPPASGTSDLDPYHAPNMTVMGAPDDLTVTNESFFPMASPHTLRSEVLIRDDVASGPQQPRVQGSPTVTSNSIILPQVGMGSENTPLLDIHFAKEDPHVHVDQDWSITYEGSLPGFEGIPGVLSTDDGHSSLLLTSEGGHFCARGVEDWAQGVLRTDAAAAALASGTKLPQLPARADRWTTDYVQLTEDLLSPGDDYWNVQQECWDPRLSTAQLRHDTCEHTFGAAVDQSPLRDYPIIEAYDDKFRLGRWYQPPAPNKDTPAPPREVVFTDPTNADALKLMRCCFHNQVKFKVRTAGVWSAVGAAVGGGPGVGFFSHQTTDDAGRCVPSCDPRESLLNGRVFTVPNGLLSTSLSRNGALSMRNPMFDVRIIGGADGKLPVRDTVYTFRTRGQFKPLFIAIGGASISVNPQSMHYVEPLGQMAVVDGASQGLVLIDLRAVTVARAPYF